MKSKLRLPRAKEMQQMNWVSQKLGVGHYFIKRDDGTTASERFYVQNHKDLFEELVKNMPYIKRSRKKLPSLAEAA